MPDRTQQTRTSLKYLCSGLPVNMMNQHGPCHALGQTLGHQFGQTGMAYGQMFGGTHTSAMWQEEATHHLECLLQASWLQQLKQQFLECFLQASWLQQSDLVGKALVTREAHSQSVWGPLAKT